MLLAIIDSLLMQGKLFLLQFQADVEEILPPPLLPGAFQEVPVIAVAPSLSGVSTPNDPMAKSQYLKPSGQSAEAV
jgi:hypothetical protein